ncbi:apyrase-like [Battus philenor]|uniref:apyrase-like n=1 Tax=Battus philenor TaxID=42288 RepID=UPI0035D01EFB
MDSDKMSIAMLNLFIVTATALSLVDGFALPFEGLYPLDIIHYNDFHARFEETSVDTATCHFNNGSCLGGFPRLYSEIMELKRQKPNSLLLNAGDSFQGTYWYTLLKWNVTQKFMNLLPHDAHAVGNHEFDDGPEGLAPYFKALKAPVVAANMDASKEPILEGTFKPHIIVKRDGRKIGIIGLITTDTKTLSSPGKVVFTDPFEATAREAKLLTEKGVDIIILLSHCGLEIDKQIAHKYGKHIDIIVGGHSHSLLWNGPSPSGEAVAGPYPVFIETSDDKQHQVLIVQASAFTKYMGNLTVYFDYLGRYVKWEGGPIFLDRSIPEDEEVKRKLLPYAKLVHDAENVPVGESVRSLRFEDCVFGECALGDLLVDAMIDFAKANVKTGYHHLAFIQRGNIKSSIMKGKITKGTIFDLLPFNDRIETFELQGKYIREALERSVIDAWGYAPFSGPWLLQVSGLNVTYNISLPEGKRIVAVNIASDSSNKLNDEQYYQVTMPAYLADGGDGFSMFMKGKQNMLVIGRDEKVLEQYINKHTPIDVNTDGRIVIIQ